MFAFNPLCNLIKNFKMDTFSHRIWQTSGLQQSHVMKFHPESHLLFSIFSPTIIHNTELLCSVCDIRQYKDMFLLGIMHSRFPYRI